jgi:hypothetical protein
MKFFQPGARCALARAATDPVEPAGDPTGATDMTSASAPASRPADSQAFISTDMAALASHMDACKQSQGHFLSLRTGGDLLRGLVSSRIVSTGALLGAAALALLLYFT